MKARLEITEGPRRGRVFMINPGELFVVGRSRFAQCPIPEDQVLSRDHFLLEVRDQCCVLRDLGSTNGTFVNAARVTEVQLEAGDVIAAGASRFTLDWVCGDPPDDATSTATLPSPARAELLSSRTTAEWSTTRAPIGESPSSQTGELVESRVRCLGCGRRAPAGLNVAGGSPSQPGPGGNESITWLCEACRGKAAESPQPIPGYTLLRQLGRGGMGVVHLARHEPTGRAVALKLIVPEVAATRSAVDRFNREVSVLRKLKHPHIVELFDHGVSRGQIWFAMEYVAGPNLDELVRRHPGPYPVGRACRVALQVLKALDHAHALGIVHRDVKPENILIGPGPEGVDRPRAPRVAKLTDFGLAKSYRGLGLSGGLTFSGELRGTLPFLPPEQVTDFRSVLPSGDLYALAATLYHLLAGRPPRDLPEDGGELMRALLEEPTIPLRRFRPDAPPGLEEVLRVSLAPNPADRFPTARAFRHALKPFAHDS